MGDPITDPEIHDGLLESTHVRLFDPGQSESTLSLAERFVFPPFTLMDAKTGPWKNRKQLWLESGLRSAKGRTARTFGKSDGQDEVTQKILALTNGQSIYDPVLCEMICRWFSPPGGTIVDPFAGGSVRGIVAAVTGRHYVGVDLSDIQVQANLLQNEEFVQRLVYGEDIAPTWITGDSREVFPEWEDWGIPEECDLIHSCPPYADLEQYSDDPRDLSNMSYAAFREAYGEIIAASCARLRNDRFAVFTVGEIRDPKTGYYRNFVGHTIDAFLEAGLHYYNEAMFASPAGTLPLRAAKQFVVSRKMGRVHQTVLVFVKGDPKKATEACADRRSMEAAAKAMGHRLEDIEQEDAPDEDFTVGWDNG